MPFLPFVVLLAWQAVSKAASFALGWATAIYFGQVPGKQGRILAVVSLAAAGWIVLVTGFALPLLVGAALDAAGVIGRNFSVQPLHVLGLGSAIVLGPPAIAAATVWGEFHDERSVQRWLHMIPSSYPATASLGLAVIQMVLFTPIIVVRRLIKKHSLLQTALSMREDADDDDLTEAVTGALATIDLRGVAAGPAPPLIAWPMRTVGYAVEHLVGAVVRGKPVRLTVDGMQLFAYATNVAVMGPSQEAHRVRSALLRELPFRNARLSWTAEAREIEDAIMGAHRAAEEDQKSGSDKLEKLRRRLDEVDISTEEWTLLDRLRLQVEQRAAERAGLYRAKVRMAKPATITKATNTTTSRATQLVRRSG